MIAHTLNSNLFSDTNGKCGSEIERVGVAVEIRDFQFLVTFTFPGEKVQIGIANIIC